MDAPQTNELCTALATGLALVDAALTLRWINPALGEWLQTGPRGAVGQPLVALLRTPALAEHARQVLATRGSLQLRAFALTGARGQPLLADLTLQPLADGQLLLEVHPLAEGLQAAAPPLSATLRGFAHEVKNPLAGLRGAAQLLERRVGEEELKALARLVIAEADRLSALADDLLRHRGAPQLVAINVHELLDRLAALVGAESHPLAIRHDYDPSLPDVEGDPDRLLQVLLNLARNAAEAGAHALLLRTRAEHGVRLGERVARRALRIDVADDGPGIPEALRDTLFQPLVSGRPGGTGLGLALSREIARDHGGELTCASRPGETVFSLHLPMEPRRARAGGSN